MQFTAWLCTQTNRQDSTGVLARAVYSDIRAPKNVAYIEFRNYLREHATYAIANFDEIGPRIHEEYANFMSGNHHKRQP